MKKPQNIKRISLITVGLLFVINIWGQTIPTTEIIKTTSDGSFSGESAQDSRDYKLLLGTWTTEASDRARTFEFKRNKTVIYSYDFETTSGGSGTHSDKMEATVKKDNIVIERSQARYARGYKSWWEISIPFDPDNLAITHCYENKGSVGNTTYKLYKIMEESKPKKESR